MDGWVAITGREQPLTFDLVCVPAVVRPVVLCRQRRRSGGGTGLALRPDPEEVAAAETL